MSKELVRKVAALKVLSDYAKAAYDTAREELGHDMERGDSLKAHSPLGDRPKIGAVYKSNPKSAAVVTDERALLAWFTEHYPDKVGSAFKVTGTAYEVLDALFKHAPHLLLKVSQIKPEAMQQLRADTLALGQPIGPGGEADVPGIKVSTPDPVVSCKPDPDTSLAAVVELIRSGELDLHAVLTPRELEAAPDAR